MLIHYGTEIAVNLQNTNKFFNDKAVILRYFMTILYRLIFLISLNTTYTILMVHTTFVAR